MTQTTGNIAEELALLEEAAKKTDTTPRDLRGGFEIGKVARQGDVYIHRVDPSHAHGSETTDRQVAVGNTQGSRHIVEGAAVKLYYGTKAPSYVDSRAPLGPLVEAESEWVLTHPEHPNMYLPAGSYQVTHQLDAITGQRVDD